MPITVEWFTDEKTVIHYEYKGKWTWEELYNAIAISNKMIDTVEGVVDTIIDLRQSSMVPANVFSHGKQALANAHPRQGKMVIVGAHRFILTLYDTFVKVYNRPGEKLPTVFIATIEEAAQYLEQIHASRDTA